MVAPNPMATKMEAIIINTYPILILSVNVLRKAKSGITYTIATHPAPPTIPSTEEIPGTKIVKKHVVTVNINEAIIPLFLIVLVTW